MKITFGKTIPLQVNSIILIKGWSVPVRVTGVIEESDGDARIYFQRNKIYWDMDMSESGLRYFNSILLSTLEKRGYRILKENIVETHREGVLHQIQEHGDWAFLQGFKAAKEGIRLEDNSTLSKMAEAHSRMRCFVSIANNLAEIIK